MLYRFSHRVWYDDDDDDDDGDGNGGGGDYDNDGDGDYDDGISSSSVESNQRPKDRVRIGWPSIKIM